MYKIKLINSDKDVLDFEQRRAKAFKSKKQVVKLEECTYALDIKKGDMLAFTCVDENENFIGGMLIELRKKCIYIGRMFVEEAKRSNGAGTFMLDYVMSHKYFFEDYFAEDINGVLVEPLDTSIEFYYSNGFESFGYQMYKRY